jgi:hypothetical protein
MRTFQTPEALVATYWRKLVSSNGAPKKGRSHVFARRLAHALQTRPRSRVRSGIIKKENKV